MKKKTLKQLYSEVETLIELYGMKVSPEMKLCITASIENKDSITPKIEFIIRFERKDRKVGSLNDFCIFGWGQTIELAIASFERCMIIESNICAKQETELIL